MKRSGFLAAVLFMGMFCLSTTGGAAGPVEKTRSAGKTDGATQEGMAVLSGNAIRDAAGRTVCTEKPYSRIISLYSAHTENLFSMGLSDEIIGVSRLDRSLAAAADKTVFAAQNSPERFIAARPDLVIVRPMLDHGYARLMEQLDRFGIQVVSLQPGDIDEMKTYWRILGRLAGKPKKAAEMVSRFEKGVSEARRISDSIHPKKRVYFEAIHGRFKTFSPGSMPVFALKTAGGINVAEDARPSRGTNIADYGKERILAKGEKIDVYLARDGYMNRPSVERIENVPGFHVIRAIREKEIYLVDEAIVSRPTIRLLEGIARIGEILYPGQFTGDARKRIVQHAHPNG